MNDLDRLVAIEDIRRLKATYWYAMDMKDYATLRQVFTLDAIFDLRAERSYARGQDAGDLPPVEQAIEAGDDAVFVGADSIAEFLRSVHENWTTVHHGHEPIIEVIDRESASGIWPLFDYIDDGTRALKGYGHYHEQYSCVGGRWQIRSSVLTRTRIDGDHPWSN